MKTKATDKATQTPKHPMKTKATDKATQTAQAITENFRAFELNHDLLRQRSERRAWLLALFLGVLSLCLAVGYWLLLPLKKEIPYLVVVDSVSGQNTVARLTPNALNSDVLLNDAINKSNVARYVTARESYRWGESNRAYWNTVFSMSGEPVANLFKQIYATENPNNPDKIWGEKTSVRIAIKSIVLLGKDEAQNKPANAAMVRFERWLVDNKTLQSTWLDNQVATVEFAYDGQLKMSEALRYDNPLGFQVTRYGIDVDLSTPNTPIATPTTPARATPPSTAAPFNAKPPISNTTPAAAPSVATPPVQ